jgi:DNA-binding response OmpR family regulator
MNRSPRSVAGAPLATTVALVGFAKPEQEFLQELFACVSCLQPSHGDLALQLRASVAAILKALRRDPITVVLCDRDLLGDAWKELLEQFACLSQPPCLIVTSRLADEYLWAEALNLGAYDVLARPFERAEVVRTVTLAHLHWQNQRAAHPQAARAIA